jgi:hypothetical protein
MLQANARRLQEHHLGLELSSAHLPQQSNSRDIDEVAGNSRDYEGRTGKRIAANGD